MDHPLLQITLPAITPRNSKKVVNKAVNEIIKKDFNFLFLIKYSIYTPIIG